MQNSTLVLIKTCYGGGYRLDTTNFLITRPLLFGTRFYLAAKLYLMLCLPHRVSTTYNTIGHYAFLLCDGNLTSSTLAGPDFALPNVEVLKATPSVAELRYGMSPVPIILFSRLT